MTEQLDYDVAVRRTANEGGGHIRLPAGHFEIVDGKLVPWTKRRRLLRLRRRWRAWRRAKPVDPRPSVPVAFDRRDGGTLIDGGGHSTMQGGGLFFNIEREK